jgi:hypothetical protein
MAADPD